MSTPDFNTPSEAELELYARILHYLCQSGRDLTLWANSGGGGNLYYDEDQLIHSWVEFGDRESTKKQLHPERDRGELLSLLYDRAKTWRELDGLLFETALLRFINWYNPEDPLLMGKPDPGVL